MMKNLVFGTVIFSLLFLFSCEKEEEDCKGKKSDFYCIESFEPVCGCDNVTYSNECYADRAGVLSWIAGECK